MTREAEFAEAQDGQEAFRVILDSMARPGQLRRLDTAKLAPPAGLAGASALLGLCLLDSEVSFHCAGFAPEVTEYLRVNTNSRVAPAAEADFVFLGDSSRLDEVAVAKTGDPEYPELSATLVLQVRALSEEPMADSLRVATSGPGVDGMRSFSVAGLETAFLTLLRRTNEEFPLGLDLVLTCGDAVLSLPRSQRLEWEGL
jgi:alpha-D-ribose 1-methylphosphonate 5-triphosphate synthase subunit PhnH